MLYSTDMLPRLRRSAGLLLALFAGHLGMVTSGAVCTTRGMGTMSAPAPMAGMAASAMSERAAGTWLWQSRQRATG